jgi:O-antigen ligase
MIRLTLVWLFVAFLSAYAWRDWFKSLCGLILFMAVVEHPDFPKSLFGIQGLNPWNILLLFVLMAWITNRDGRKSPWDMPRNISILLLVYFLIIVLSFIRMASDIAPISEFQQMLNIRPDTFLSLVSEHIVNCLKWVIPGILLFDGCRSERQLRWGVACTLGIYVLLAVQVIRWMPLSSITSGGDLEARSMKLLLNEIGYHRVNISMMLAGGSWALFAARDLFKSEKVRLFVTFLSAIVFFGMALTGGRMGYVTWALVGLIFAAFRWRRIFILAPAALLMVVLLIPAAQERFMQGFDAESVDTNIRIEEHLYRDDDGPDLYTITSGRTFAWPWVISMIGEAPLVGHGREAMVTTGLAATLWLNYQENFPHPHNAYLQWILDNGIIGFIPLMLFYFLILKMAFRMFSSREHALISGIGGVTVALVSALLIASMGSQSFYPREGSVAMWCAIGLTLRVFVQQKKMAMGAQGRDGLNVTDVKHEY